MIGGERLKIKLEREGAPEMVMELEPPAKLDLKGKVRIEFERPLSIRVSGEGKAELELPLSAAVKGIRLEGDATIVIEPEGAPAFRIPKRAPTGEVMKKLLGALEPGLERALSSYELASKAGLSEKQVRAPLGRLVNRRLADVTGKKGEKKYYKLEEKD